MPPLARAAIWLVVFRRWPYGDASIVLGTDVDGVKDLLRYRQVLMTAVVRRSVDRNGTDHHDQRH
jgi:DNA-directed RNA polymerase specialized sigma24 family protein